MILALLVSSLTLAQAPAAQAPAGTEAFRFEYLRTRDRIEADGQAQRTIEVGILLRTPSAISQFGQLALGYIDGFGDARFEGVRITKPGGEARAVTDGRLEDLNPFGINDASIPIDVRVRKLTIPGLEPGDRLAYRLVTTLNPFVPGEAYGEMRFAPATVDTPQTYELDIPAESKLRVTLRPTLGVPWEAVSGEPGRLVRRLTVSIPPPVIASTGITEAQVESFQEPDVSFTTFASWPDVGRWWWQMSQDQVRADDAIRKEAARLVAGRKTPREKIEAIGAFVGSTIRYLNVSFGMGRMQPRAAGAVLSSRFGDCKDKVGLVMALADAVGIEVRPVLIHSSRLDLKDEAPGPHQFDHVIAAAILGPSEKDWLWIDPTNALSLPTSLFTGLRDKRALAVDRSGRATLVRTPVGLPFPTTRQIEVTGALDPAGLLKGRVKLTDRSDSEAALRGAFASTTAEQHAEVMKTLLAAPWKDARLSKVRTADPGDLATPFWVELEFERDVTGIDSEKEWDFWIPDAGPVLSEASSDATSKKPVRFDMSEFIFKAAIALPEGTAARAPLSISMDRPFVSLTSSYAVDGATLKAERKFQMPAAHITREQLPAYEALRKAAATDREQDFKLAPLKVAAPTAASLQKEGKAAYSKKDYVRAAELLQKAATLDSKLAGVHLDLGLALRQQEKYEDAVAAYAKGIEVDPFHESIYAERAYALFELDKPAEAEKDLLKQIEVAPFKEWSYRRLARYRVSQSRHAEAAELYTKSLAIDAKPVDDWVELGYAHARAGKATDARTAWVKAESLGLGVGAVTNVGLGYALIGDHAQAAILARKDLPEIERKVAEITPENFNGQFYWTKRLAEAWTLIGRGALEAGDEKTAEAYLQAGWEGAVSPDAALALATLRVRQSRLDEASTLLAAAVQIRPKAFGDSAAQAIIKAAGSHAIKATGGEELSRLRVIELPGTTSPALSENARLLLSGGKVIAATAVSKDNEAKLRPALDALVGKASPGVGPDGKPPLLVRDGYISCSGGGACRFTTRVESPDRPQLPALGSLKITRMFPADGTILRAGQKVHLSVTADYEVEGGIPGVIALVVADGPSKQIVKPQPERRVSPGKGTVELQADFTVPAGSRTIFVFLPLSVNRAPTSTVGRAAFQVEP